MYRSDISRFYRLSMSERRARIAELTGMGEPSLDVLSSGGGLQDEQGLRILVHLPFPTVNGNKARDHVYACSQTSLHDLPSQGPPGLDIRDCDQNDSDCRRRGPGSPTPRHAGAQSSSPSTNTVCSRLAGS